MPNPRKSLLGPSLAAFALAALYFFFHWMGFKDGPPMRDFLGPYTGARCLWRGCNPYDQAQVVREFTAAGGLEAEHPVWHTEPLVYPPSTLVALLPISFLPYHVARAVWYLLSTVLFCAGLLTIAALAQARHRPWIVLLAAGMLWSEPVELLWNVGQPTAVAFALAAFALWCFLQNRFLGAGVVCLGIALALKLQVAGMVLLFLVVRPRFRWPAVAAFLVSGLLFDVGYLWLTMAPASSHTWKHDLHGQIAGSLLPGDANDPSLLNRGAAQFTNLQADIAPFIADPARVNAIAYGVTALLFAAWLWMAWRSRESGDSEFATLAAIACIGLLPVYHREYDLVILAMSFLALLPLFSKRHWLAWPAASATALLLFTSPHLRHGWVRFAGSTWMCAHLPDARWRAVLLLRPAPWLLLVLALVYLLGMTMKIETN